MTTGTELFYERVHEVRKASIAKHTGTINALKRAVEHKKAGNDKLAADWLWAATKSASIR